MSASIATPSHRPVTRPEYYTVPSAMRGCAIVCHLPHCVDGPNGSGHPELDQGFRVLRTSHVSKPEADGWREAQCTVLPNR